jgi:hypothetical protein
MVTISEAVDALLESLALDELGEARAATARLLAERLDAARGSNSGVISQAVPPLSRELHSILSQLTSTDVAADFTADLFAGLR